MGYYKTNYYHKKRKIDYTRPTLKNPDYVAYTDGACWQEKYGTSIGRGGYGTIVIQTGSEDFKGVEYSEGYQLTTNNRMELMAVIVALQNVPADSTIRVYSDSQYVIKIMRGENSAHENQDLWDEYNNLIWSKHLDVDPVWVKGHNGNNNNERCDRLAKRACRKERLLHDEWYEEKKTSHALEYEMDIPEKYRENNARLLNREYLINENHVNPKCADAILAFWSYDSPKEEEYGALKVFGSDYWSEYYYDWFAANIEEEVLKIVEEAFDDIDLRERCLRWYMRGLSLYDAINKAAYDFEMFVLKK